MSDAILQVNSAGGFGNEEQRRKYYVAHNATFRTGLNINADPGAIAATEGMMSVYNSASRTSGSNKNTLIVPQYLKLVTKVVGASGTDFSIRIANDNTNRYSSGGASLTVSETYVDTFTSFARRTSKATVKFGDLTLAAASSEKQVGQVTLHSATAAQVVGDQYLIVWGDPTIHSALLSASAAQSYTQNVQQIVIAPGCSMILQPFSTSAASTAAQFEVEFGFLEIKR
jgi:hypothetical protein